MNRRFALIVTTALASLLMLGASASARAQVAHRASAPRYRLIDLGTLGGPISFYDGAEPGLMMNAKGTVIGFAETAVKDPHAPSSCSDCYIADAVSGNTKGLTDLPSLPGRNSGHTDAISDSGVVVGQTQNGKIDPNLKVYAGVATYWKNGKIHRLRGLGGPQSFAMGVNDRGEIVGQALNNTPYSNSIWGNLGTEQRAVLWRGGKVRDLGSLGGPSALAFFINARGQIAGQAETNSTVNPATGSPTVVPFLWWKGHMRSLGTLGGTNGGPASLNDRGQVAGASDLKGDQISHPFVWGPSMGMKDLGTLGGANGYASWMNNAGRVVGTADLPGSQVHHAFLWRNGHMIDLGAAKGLPCSHAYGINSKDQVVGTSGICGGPEYLHRAFLWEKGHMTDLNSLISPPASGLTVADGNAINGRGDIAGDGFLPNGDEHLVLLVPQK